MPRAETILPVSSSQMEVDMLDAFIEVIEETIGDPMPLRFLWNAAECPVDFLPYLACAWSVDGDPTDFSTEQLRNLIADSLNIHLKKGTVWSVKRVVELLGYGLVNLIEGDRDTDGTVIREDGRWAHFSVEIATPISVQAANAAVSLIQNIAPLTRKLTLFTYSRSALRWDGSPDNEGNYTVFFDGTYNFGDVVITDIAGAN